jgi:translocator protein
MKYKRLLISLLIPQLAGIIGSFFTIPAISTWYSTLIKPSFNPPNYIFGPMWIILYFLMGISIYLIWQKIDENKIEVIKYMRIFWIHILFNSIWSIMFFGLQNLWLAFINIMIIWLFIIILIIKSYKINKLSSYLLIPYLIWVSFASILNLSILLLN